ncbi:FecR domain-containing protein [Fulvivirga ligni]|uniref:FecR domain-containing protein n=1 Tax=Fulvivirga ligni TaxID=2904246 RepID=UPI001F3A8EA1|nr:FecR domain-containing protein [Fulvivirga ligni]UII21385.1 FecR domain-containing protein [Fulvivirga ligni]
MDHTENHIDESLVLAYLKGEQLPEDEAQRVERWLESASNQDEAQKIYQAWELSLLAGTRNVDVNDAFQKVQQQIEDSSPKGKTAKITPVWWYAAASVIIIAVSVFLFTKNQTVDTQASIKQLTAEAAKQEFDLEDHTTISLKKDAVITYDSVLFSSSPERIVNLKGEAFFEVAHNKERPFSVLTSDAKITVLGTKFLVKTFPNELTEVLVLEGTVAVKYNDNEKAIILQAQEEVVSKNDNQPIIKSSADVNQLYWQTGIMQFKNDSLSNVFETLSHEFNHKIVVENEAVNHCKITATFKKQSLETIIKVIESTHDLTSYVSGDSIMIKGNGCK